MIGIIFTYINDIIEVRIHGDKVYFRNKDSAGFSQIDGLKLSRVGVEKEFPDLKGNSKWRIEGIKRFKEKIVKMKDEEERTMYIISELKKFGYVPKYKQKAGHRPIKI